MGWFSRNRRPFSLAFFERLDRIEATVIALLGEGVQEAPVPEVIPAKIVSSRIADGVEEFAWREVTTDPDDDGGRSSDGYDAAGAEDPYAFAAKAADESQSFIVKHWVTATEDGNAIHDVRYTLMAGDKSFWAMIGESIPIEGRPQWRYAWTEVEMQAGVFVNKTDGRSSGSIALAQNSLEHGNVSGSGYGIVVLSGGVGIWYIHDTDSQFQFLPVPGGAVVRMRIEMHNGVAYPVFAAPNPIDGVVACPEEETP